MLIPTIIMGVLAIVLLYVGYAKGQQQHVVGLKSALTLTIQILPLLVFALVVAGMVQELLPKEQLSKWVGAESGMRGILLASVAGGLAPGGPYVSLPVAVGLVRAGASVGTIVAFLTAWSLWAVSRLPLEVGVLGWKVTAIRLASSFVFPPIIGFLAQTFFGNVKLM